MPHNVKVTVGLCVRNAETTIRQAIESILEQDFPCEFLELLVVDGNSEDKTLPIIKESLVHSNMKIEIFREREGLASARQIVVNNASGDYIVWDLPKVT